LKDDGRPSRETDPGPRQIEFSQRHDWIGRKSDGVQFGDKLIRREKALRLTREPGEDEPFAWYRGGA
jgi:hypothetical protein